MSFLIADQSFAAKDQYYLCINLGLFSVESHGMNVMP